MGKRFFLCLQTCPEAKKKNTYALHSCCCRCYEVKTSLIYLSFSLSLSHSHKHSHTHTHFLFLSLTHSSTHALTHTFSLSFPLTASADEAVEVRDHLVRVCNCVGEVVCKCVCPFPYLERENECCLIFRSQASGRSLKTFALTHIRATSVECVRPGTHSTNSCKVRIQVFLR